MKIMSKIFSIALVVIMLLSTFAVVAAVPASAENEPVYLHKFTESNFAGWVNSVGINNVVDEVTETGTLEYYEDGSFKIKKPIDYCGAIVDFDLTAEAAGQIIRNLHFDALPLSTRCQVPHLMLSDSLCHLILR